MLKAPTIDAAPATSGIQTSAKWRATATAAGLTVTAGATVLVTVNRATPAVALEVASPTVTAGGNISAAATVSPVPNGPPATGTVTFSVYGPNDATCAGPPFAQSPPVALANGSAQSPQSAVTQPGSYRFIATYSGDANYLPAMTSCGDPLASVNVTAAGGAYRPLTPARIVDSRFGPGTVAPLPGGQERNITVVGVGAVPATGVDAVVLNVVATNTAAGGYLTVYPAGATRPTAANLNWDTGETVPNLVEMPVGVGGQVTVFNGSPGPIDLVIDVSGWVATPAASTGPDGLYNPVVPTRLADTRGGSQVGPNGSLPADGTMSVTVAGTGQVAGNPVPASGVSAVVLNVTVVTPSAGGFLTVFPAGETRPLAANLNFVPGQIVPNRVIVKVGAGGQINIFNGSGGPTDVVVDVGGWFTSAASAAGGARFNGLPAPNRITDTRPAPHRVGPNATLGPSGEITVTVAGTPGVPASGAKAVVLNVAVTNPSAFGFLTVYPADAARPLAADQNWPPGDTRSNLVVVKLSPAGAIKLFNGSPGVLDVVIDVIGWYA